MKLSPRFVQAIKDNAVQKFKERSYTVYDSELQATVCTLLAFSEVLKQEFGIDLALEAEVRAVHEPVDDLG